ncbi:hypothetical protein LK996_12255 [Lysobacter sp. A6]|uniref:VRR-NUC domain-containing protein n=1 Tax=Noviluteimonas lactosilytica TaxID=2888523 RepID=A0ABS8JJQ8_9GAMM|nr:hypothetical protein [Lysobacter lactosilyticus]MCC8363846.1 hypothetical protein [Lysobacter lactosilyticus]
MNRAAAPDNLEIAQLEFLDAMTPRLNERKTEDLVEKHLRKMGYFKAANQLIVEKQSSDSPRIQKLLATASKKGGGIGRPEFIVSSKSVGDFIIVVECKASRARHQSATLG